MKVRKVNPDDFEQIKEWGKQWGADYDEDQFPNTGFIIDGIAAYFLYGTDSTVCWLENLVSKRGVAEHVREKALELLIVEALKEAKEMGYEVAYATTDIVAVARRARDHGATIKTHQFLITKDLTKTAQLQ